MKKNLITISLFIFIGFTGCNDSFPVPEIEMIHIRAGTFNMGYVGVIYAEPVHEVTITKDYYMSKYPITVGDFRIFAQNTHYKTLAERGYGGKVFIELAEHEIKDANWKNPYYEQNDRHPVVLISWLDAIEYCNWLSKINNLTPVYKISGRNITPNWNANGFRLPTEAEWEYACRAGTTTLYYTGYTITDNDAWFRSNSGFGTNEVGLKPPNPWGLHDMHGNIWEWVWDWRDNSYTPGDKVNPTGVPNGGPYRASRGGSWINVERRLNSAERSYGTPNYRTNLLGFRVVRTYQ